MFSGSTGTVPRRRQLQHVPEIRRPEPSKSIALRSPFRLISPQFASCPFSLLPLRAATLCSLPRVSYRGVGRHSIRRRASNFFLCPSRCGRLACASCGKLWLLPTRRPMPKSTKISAGLLLYRRKNGELEFLLAHLGGPF